MNRTEAIDVCVVVLFIIIVGERRNLGTSLESSSRRIIVYCPVQSPTLIKLIWASVLVLTTS
jgi:hypothetical protein